MAGGIKIKDLDAYQRSPRSGPVLLIALPSPARDFLGLSITSFCFCVMLAIPALLFSFKTRQANSVGDWKKARRNSMLALGFSISSILVGCILMASSITFIFEIEA